MMDNIIYPDEDNLEQTNFFDEDDDYDSEILECPNCNAIWGFDEMELQKCFSCGYPDNEDDDDDFDDEYGIQLEIEGR